MVFREQHSEPVEEAGAPISPQQLSDAEGIEKAEAFLRDVAPHLGRLFGMDLSITIGNGWATDMESGQVMADPKFFIEKGYTPDMASYATLHEIAAHLREVVNEPKLTEEVIGFIQKGSARGIFHNIFSDIAGNKLIHAVLPKTMPKVASDMYSEKLFPGDDYSKFPRHLQFLYKIMREEMIPDSQTTAVPEVDAAIESLRDYKGKGDLVKYSTAVAKSRREVMSPQEKFKMWSEMIYPVFESLLEQDKDDPIDDSDQNNEPNQGDQSQDQQENPEQLDNNQQDDSGENDQQNQEQDGQDEQQPKDQSESDEETQDDDQDGDPSPSDNQSPEDNFQKYYDDYHENIHPEPFTEEEEEELREYGRTRPDPNATPSPQAKPSQNEILDARIRQETGGHTLEEQKMYTDEILNLEDEITAMRDVFKEVIERRVTERRGLGRRGLPEGAILDPNRIAQTVVDMNAGIENPDAFLDYETRRGQNETFGNTDYIFIFDVSTSMKEYGRSKAAASAAVIGLEGLAAMQRDILEAESTYHTDLGLEIRTAIYTFGEATSEIKPLSSTLDSKERLDTYAAVSSPNQGNTNDFLTFEYLNTLKDESDRRKIVISITDGASSGSYRAQTALNALKAKGWLIYGIGIQSDAATALYRPNAQRVDDPRMLPSVIKKFIEDSVSE